MRIPRGLPSQITTTLRYVAEIAVLNVDNRESGVIGSFLFGQNPYIFSLNNIYDPNYTGTAWNFGSYNHQPRGHDQLLAIYNKYCVIGAKVQIKPLFLNHPSGNTGHCSRDLTLYATIDDDVSNATLEFDKHEMLEGNAVNHKKIKYITPFVSQRFGLGTGNIERVAGIPKKSFKMSWSAKKFFKPETKLYKPFMPGRGETQSDTQFEADYGSAPLQQAFLKIWCNNGFDTSTPAHVNTATGIIKQYTGIQCQVIIDYLVVSHSMRELGQS